MADELFEGNLALADNYREEQPTELINGKIIAMASPSFEHHWAALHISNILLGYFKSQKFKRCVVFGDGMDLFLTPRDCFRPDGMVVCDWTKIKRNGVHGAPDLVIEVLSPSTEDYDRGYKKNVYGSCGVKEYWLVNPDCKSIEVYLLKDGKLEFSSVYRLIADEELAEMSEKQRARVIKEFKCSLFDDLIIKLEEIFYDWHEQEYNA